MPAGYAIYYIHGMPVRAHSIDLSTPVATHRLCLPATVLRATQQRQHFRLICAFYLQLIALLHAKHYRLHIQVYIGIYHICVYCIQNLQCALKALGQQATGALKASQRSLK